MRSCQWSSEGGGSENISCILEGVGGDLNSAFPFDTWNVIDFAIFPFFFCRTWGKIFFKKEEYCRLSNR